MIMKVKRILQYIWDPAYRMGIDSRWGRYNYLSDEEYLKKRFKLSFKRSLDLKSPSTFNEKLQWLKLYDRRPEYTVMVDKNAAKQYVAERIGERYIIPTLGVWDRFDDIDFEMLPKQFVLKCTHDSGGLIICRDKEKLNKAKAKRRLCRSLKRSFYERSREWPYKDVPRRIIAEEYMEDAESRELRDYKVHSFNGEPRFILVCSNRFGTSGLAEDFYTDTWEHIEVRRPEHPNANCPIGKPEELEQILELSRILSKGIPFLRTDFYIINHRIYFGELTFYPASGFTGFVPEKFDHIFGSYLRLPLQE